MYIMYKMYKLYQLNLTYYVIIITATLDIIILKDVFKTEKIENLFYKLAS